MTPDPRPSARLLLVLVLLLALSANLHAAPLTPRNGEPQPATPALLAEWFDFVPVNSRPSRTTVIRITAVAMALALFIMLRNKH